MTNSMRQISDLCYEAYDKHDYNLYKKLVNDIYRKFPCKYTANIFILDLGLFYLTKERDYKKAENCFRKILNSKKKQAVILAHYYLGLLFFRQGRYKLSKSFFNKLKARFPYSKFSKDSNQMIQVCEKKLE